MMRLSRLIAGGAAVGSALAVTGFLLTPEQDSIIETLRLFKYGVPENSISLHNYKGHWLAYDSARRIPVWVAEFLDKDMLHRSVAKRQPKSRPKFKVDPDIEYQASDDDYLHSGWHKGHMAAAANHKHNKQEMSDTFYYSNVVPQDPKNNIGFWKMLETFCRELVTDHKKVTVLTGPLFLPQRGENDKYFVHYEVIGHPQHQVAVPTHLYKVIVLDDDRSRETYLGVFIIPNKPIIEESSLAKYQKQLEYLEHYLGTKLLPKMNSKKCKDLCTVSMCELMASGKLKVQEYAQRLEGAQNLNSLEKIWKEDGGKHQNPYCKEVYTQRKRLFKQ